MTNSLTTREPKVYRGDALRAVAMPLGGIGTGSIALCGDGSLRQWQIHNQANHLACLPHSFFAVWARPERHRATPVARVLQSAELYDTTGVPSPPTANDNVVPEVQRALLATLPGVAKTSFVGEYPVAELAYEDDSLVVQVGMEAFSPFVPLDAKNSALPAIIFNLTLHNPAAEPYLVSLAASLQNATGWDGVTPVVDNRCGCYGGNANALVRLSDMTAIQMGNAHLPEQHAGYGSMVLAALAPDATALAQYDSLPAFWADLSADGRLDNASDSTPSAAGCTWNGALAVPFRLAPGESRTVTFLIAWHYPNRYVNWQQVWLGPEHNHSQFWLGNRYATWFRSALDVAVYVTNNWRSLVDTTRLARRTLYDTTLPWALIDAAISQVSVMRSPTCFWTADGRFYGFEGCCGASVGHSEPVGGCCPLNCTHVWNYEMALARLFPDLERSMRDIEWSVQQQPSGYLPHRVVMPLYLPRLWEKAIAGPEKPALDGLLGGILKTYREYRACGDIAWLAAAWPAVKRALHNVWNVHDPDFSGVIAGEQPNTYDVSIYGANTFVGTLYLAALRSAEAMSILQDDQDFAARCREIAERGRASIEGRLWNGEYYVHETDPQHLAQSWGSGCHADQLLGQWWAHTLGLGYLLDSHRVRQAALAIFRHNFRASFRGIEQRPRVYVTADDQGLQLCSWPHGGRPEVPIHYADEVWSGIEYEVASLLLWEGETEAAVRIVEAARARYDGRKQSPWNDVECGDHYVRAMASWALLEAAAGYRYNAAEAEIALAPAVNSDVFRAPFVARDGWGTLAEDVLPDAQQATIAVRYGTLDVRTVRLRERVPIGEAAVALGDVQLPATLTRNGSELTVRLEETATVYSGQQLQIALQGSAGSAERGELQGVG